MNRAGTSLVIFLAICSIRAEAAPIAAAEAQEKIFQSEIEACSKNLSNASNRLKYAEASYLKAQAFDPDMAAGLKSVMQKARSDYHFELKVRCPQIIHDVLARRRAYQSGNSP
jgi:hypothetical protein